MLPRVASWRWLLAGVVFWLSALEARAQVVPPHGYEFLTVSVSYATADDFARIYFFPAFQNKQEIVLEAGPAPGENLIFYNTKNQVRYKAVGRRNAELLNRQLGEITAAGWELAHVWSEKGEPVTYLFHKPRP